MGSRSILIEMRRRAPDETIEPFRVRLHKQEAGPLYGGLAAWATFVSKQFSGVYPDMPAEISDREADCWEPLLAIADAAGSDWPEMARDAAVSLVRRGKEQLQTTGIELLQHILEAFGDDEKMWTSKLLKALCERDESPWAEDGKRPTLNDRRLGKMLTPYGIKSKDVRIGDLNRKGYLAEDFVDAWNRYLDPSQAERYKRYKRYKIDNENKNVADVADVADRSGNWECTACDGLGCPTCHPENYGMRPRPPGGYGPGRATS